MQKKSQHLNWPIVTCNTMCHKVENLGVVILKMILQFKRDVPHDAHIKDGFEIAKQCEVPSYSSTTIELSWLIRVWCVGDKSITLLSWQHFHCDGSA